MRNWFWLFFFGLSWLLPATWHGLLQRRLPGAPALLVQTTNVSCLFVSPQPYTPVQYIQVLLPGASAWTTEEDSHYFRMTPFGSRTRFDELLRKRLDSPSALKEVAGFIRERHARRTGVLPAAVRFVTGIVLPAPNPSGRFRKPPLAAIPHGLRQVWFTQIYGRVPTELLRKSA